MSSAESRVCFLQRKPSVPLEVRPATLAVEVHAPDADRRAKCSQR